MHKNKNKTQHRKRHPNSPTCKYENTFYHHAACVFSNCVCVCVYIIHTHMHAWASTHAQTYTQNQDHSQL